MAKSIPEDILNAANAFAKDCAARFNMPELALPIEWAHGKSGDGTSIQVPDDISILPVGQMAALVTELSVHIKVHKDAFDQFYGDLHLSYRHPGGGSNGHSFSCVFIVKNGSFGNRNLIYDGFVTLDQYHLILNEHRRIVDRAEKETDAKNV